jgi:hypothetical protein
MLIMNKHVLDIHKHVLTLAKHLYEVSAVAHPHPTLKSSSFTTLAAMGTLFFVSVLFHATDIIL